MTKRRAYRSFLSYIDFSRECGKPWDKKMQRSIMDMALELLQFVRQPRTTVQAPFIWSEDET